MKHLVRFLRLIPFFRSFELRYSLRTEVLEVTLDLLRLHQRLFEITQVIKKPDDISEMREGRVPFTVDVEILDIIDRVMDEPLTEAIDELFKVPQITEEDLRELCYLRQTNTRREESVP